MKLLIFIPDTVTVIPDDEKQIEGDPRVSCSQLPFRQEAVTEITSDLHTLPEFELV
jgi:hypothetical protein